MNTEESVYKTSLLLVEHFDQCRQRGGKGIHSRIFSHMLHPEVDFVAAGRSQAVVDGEPPYPEHVVPCSTLITEVFRLLEKGEQKHVIAALLAKHWKIVFISKEQANYLDSKQGLGLKHNMPPGWCFETGDTFERLKRGGIEVFPL